MANQDPAVDDKDHLLKEAADLLDAAQRREDAVKLAFQMVELGKIPPFESLSALNEKVASLMGKDLRVVEQALELDVDLPDFGKVASEQNTPSLTGFDAATAAMAHMLADDPT